MMITHQPKHARPSRTTLDQSQERCCHGNRWLKVKDTCQKTFCVDMTPNWQPSRLTRHRGRRSSTSPTPPIRRDRGGRQRILSTTTCHASIFIAFFCLRIIAISHQHITLTAPFHRSPYIYSKSLSCIPRWNHVCMNSLSFTFISNQTTLDKLHINLGLHISQPT